MDISPLHSLETYLLALGDDELILSHRAAEWCGRAPILEEDIAFANLALDELGHASLWYTQLARQRSEDTESYPDQLVYFRHAKDFFCFQMVELPNGDWAFSMLCQYMFDALETVRLSDLQHSPGRLRRRLLQHPPAVDRAGARAAKVKCVPLEPHTDGRRLLPAHSDGVRG